MCCGLYVHNISIIMKGNLSNIHKLPNALSRRVFSKRKKKQPINFNDFKCQPSNIFPEVYKDDKKGGIKKRDVTEAVRNLEGFPHFSYSENEYVLSLFVTEHM